MQTTNPEAQIPHAPPASLRLPYLQLSWSYLYWCGGMFIWSLLCVGYFILTRQTLEMSIGITLGLLLILMIVFPALFFGRKTWHKRLAWITVLTTLFSILFLYPLAVIAIGTVQRLAEGRYFPLPSFNDTWHLLLSILTIALSIWTLRLSLRAIRLVQQLRRGDYPPTPAAP